MTPADRLILDAKQAILEEQHKRFRILQQEGRWSEALQQLRITLGCAADLLHHSHGLLERILAERRKADRGPILP